MMKRLVLYLIKQSNECGLVGVSSSLIWKNLPESRGIGDAHSKNNHVTLPETNIAPENGWLEYYFPIGMAYFQVLC